MFVERVCSKDNNPFPVKANFGNAVMIIERGGTFACPLIHQIHFPTIFIP